MFPTLIALAARIAAAADTTNPPADLPDNYDAVARDAYLSGLVHAWALVAPEAIRTASGDALEGALRYHADPEPPPPIDYRRKSCPVRFDADDAVCGRTVTNGVTCGIHAGHVTSVCVGATADPTNRRHRHETCTGRPDGRNDRACVCACHDPKGA